MSNIVSEPILNSPFAEPKFHWYIDPSKPPEKKEGRRQSIIFPPERDGSMVWEPVPGILEISNVYPRAYSLSLVQKIRTEIQKWRESNYEGATNITRQLLQHWTHTDRSKKLFYAQIEAVETIIFLREARKDFLAGISIPKDFTPPKDANNQEYTPQAFLRYASKMATGTGKSTVMGMLIAWNLLNRAVDKKNPNYTDTVLIVVPNVTIRERLNELKPESGEASLYRSRDLVPPDLFPLLNQGKVVIVNWHVFEPQNIQTDGARVIKAGVTRKSYQKIKIGTEDKLTRGVRTLSLSTLETQISTGTIQPTGNKKLKKDGSLEWVEVVFNENTESDLAVVKRILGRESSSRSPVLVLNDEAHHAYRIQKEELDEEEELDFEEEDDDDTLVDERESTVWVEGLDRIHKIRKIQFCVDLSATPYFIGRAGKDTGKPFPWTVSDFPLQDAIESGLVKIPQLALRDSTGKDQPAYFRLWDHVLSQMTPSERGGKKANPKPEAVLKYAHNALAMIMGEYENTRLEWLKRITDNRPPVLIIICKTKKIADILFDWIGKGISPNSIPPHAIQSLKNTSDQENTIRVYSDVNKDSDSGNKNSENLWMRYTLQTVGKTDWLKDLQGRIIYPEGFEEVADKLGKPKHPPGRDVRCIVSVSMLTEGWDCNTVTQIVGLRPFQSQLLCEQVVGRGLRRAYYELNENGLFDEENSQILGVPFEVIPVRGGGGTTVKPTTKNRVFAVPDKSHYEITYPRVEKYLTKIKTIVRVNWDSVPSITLDPTRIPAEVELKGLSVDTNGKSSFHGPGTSQRIGLAHFRERVSVQQLSWAMASNFTIRLIQENKDLVSHKIFPQLFSIITEYISKKVKAVEPNEPKDVFLQPYYGMMEDAIFQFLESTNEEEMELPMYEKHRPDGSTRFLDKVTKKNIYPVNKSHANAMIADTDRFEQSAAYALDGNKNVISFIKNTGLGFGILYQKNEEQHDYEPDFIVKIKKTDGSILNLILETKGYDFNQDVELKKAATLRWVKAVNQEGSKGKWDYCLVKDIGSINAEIEKRLG